MKTDYGNEERAITLQLGEVHAFRYFIRRYMENFRKGDIEASHHDAIAVLLNLGIILGEENEQI